VTVIDDVVNSQASLANKQAFPVARRHRRSCAWRRAGGRLVLLRPDMRPARMASNRRATRSDRPDVDTSGGADRGTSAPG
jgi:hypothetical protein